MLVFGKSGAVRLWSSSGRCLDSRSSCVFGEGMQVSLVLLMLVIFDGFLIFQFTDSCFGSFWLFLVPRDSRGASGFYFGNGNRVAELHQSWLSGIYMLLWIVTEILSVFVFLITLHWPFQVLRPLCVCVCVFIQNQVSDVVPVACRAAADAGIRSVCVTNFRYLCYTTTIL